MPGVVFMAGVCDIEAGRGGPGRVALAMRGCIGCQKSCCFRVLILCRRAAGVYSFVVLGRSRGSVVLIIKLSNSCYGEDDILKKIHEQYQYDKSVDIEKFR